MILQRLQPVLTFCLGFGSLLLSAPTSLAEELSLASPFSDHAVFQREKPVPIWGKATPGAEITVTFKGQNASATADDNGNWKAMLEPLEASAEPSTLTVASGEDQLTREDILVGEVWMATGQSNMAWKLASCRAPDFKIAETDPFDQIRFIVRKAKEDFTPATSFTEEWTSVLDKAAIVHLSGPAYFFGRELHETLGVPIGIIDASLGGTHIDSWISPTGWELEPSLAEQHEKRAAFEANNKNGASRLFNFGVHPWIGYGLRGFIWHQGEGSFGDGYVYLTKLKALINGYRNLWGEELPFAVGQLYPFQADFMKSIAKREKWAEAQWAQALASREIPHTGAILLSDLGRPLNIHPGEKAKAGHRYALWARHDIYGEADLPYCGPFPSRIESSEHGYHVYFDHSEGGLATRDGLDPRWFRFVSEDGTAKAPRQVHISEDRTHVYLEHPAILKSPIAKIQLGWHCSAILNLMNSAELPATPFEWDLQKDGVSPFQGTLPQKEELASPPSDWKPAPNSDQLMLCAVFSDGMVLQRDQPVPIWGWAPTGETITVSLDGSSYGATADETGRWQVELPAMAATSEPLTIGITTSGGQSHEIKDVLVGEVWIASGQSNMQWKLVNSSLKNRKLAQQDDLPDLRIFLIDQAFTWQPQKTVPGRWIPNEDKRGLYEASGLAYGFARTLQKELGIPVGILQAAVGGSTIESWANHEGLASQPAFKEHYKKRLIAAGDDPESSGLKLFRNSMGTWEAMMSPLVPYAARGFIWHQGEQNAANGRNYRPKLHGLIHGWRTAWDNPDMYFGIGQLYAFNVPYLDTWEKRERWILTQNAQQQAGDEIDKAGCIVLSDLGTPHNIHPQQKIESGERYAAWALHDVYGREDVIPSGPRIKSAKLIENDTVELTFDHVGEGLKTWDGHDPKWFKLYGQEGGGASVRPLLGEDGKTILLKTVKYGPLKKPVIVQHAWDAVAIPNVQNSAGLTLGNFEIEVEEPEAADKQASAPAKQPDHAAKKPNIILVMTDDQGYGDLSCHGHPFLKTPHLDQLHSESIRFTDFLASPGCAPTRASLMSGKDAYHVGVTSTILERERMDLSVKTVADVMKSVGYTTGIFGKWHLGDADEYQPHNRGFDEVFVHGAGGIGQKYPGTQSDANGLDYNDPVIKHNGTFVKTKGYCTDVFFQEALSWMKQSHEAGKPFFAYIPTNAPHAPHLVPEKYSNLYINDCESEPAKFYGMIANIDENMGLLMEKLKEWKLEEDTILIFLTDNGTSVGAKHNIYNAGMKGGKGSVYNGGSRVPLFVRWPAKLKAGIDVEQHTRHFDILPTLADIAGADVSEMELTGRSLVPLLHNPQAEWDDRYTFFKMTRWKKKNDTSKYSKSGVETPEEDKYRKLGVRSENWHLVSNLSSGFSLYNIDEDPGEDNNLIADHPEIADKMKAAYDKWWTKMYPFMMMNEDATLDTDKPFRDQYNRQKKTEGIPDWEVPEL